MAATFRRAMIGLTLVAAAGGLAWWIGPARTGGPAAADRQETPAPAGRVVAAAPVPSPLRFHVRGAGEVTALPPSGETRGVVLLLAGSGTSALLAHRVASALAPRGFAVGMLSAPTLLGALEAGPDRCIDPGPALVLVSQEVQHRLGLEDYQPPVLVGLSTGATLAYAAMAQGAAGLWRGAVSIGFDPVLPGSKAWCRGNALAVARAAGPAPGWRFLPAPLPGPWVAIEGDGEPAAARAAAATFAATTPGAGYVRLAADSPQLGPEPALERALLSTLSDLAGATPRAASDMPSDLPLAVYAAAQGAEPDRRVAIIFSGDGGWAGLDRSLARTLAARGIPVIGFDSLRYFWRARTPGSTAADLARLIEATSAAQGRPRILLVGYSFGADVLPATVRALPAASKSAIEELVLLAPAGTAHFQFRLTDWLHIDRDGRAIGPDLAALRPLLVRCIEGAADRESACRLLPPSVCVITLPGGHHFNGDAAAIASAILDPERCR